MSLLYAAICVIALTSTANSANAQLSGVGPIPIRDSRPYNLLFLQLRPESAQTLSKGSSSWNVQLDLINNMLVPAPYNGIDIVEDNEYDRLSLHHARGIGHAIEITFDTSLIFRNGGILDDLMNAWHRFTGFGNTEDDPAGRQNLPAFKSHLILTDGSGKSIVNQGNAFGLGESALGIKKLISQSNRSTISARLGVKLPTGNPRLFLGSGRPDIGASVDVDYRLANHLIAYANLGGVLTGGMRRLPGVSRTVGQVMGAIEYHPNSRDSYIIQSDASAPTVTTGNPFVDRANITGTFGYARKLSSTKSAYISFSENGDYHNYTIPQIGNIGPDFSVTVGMQFRR